MNIVVVAFASHNFKLVKISLEHLFNPLPGVLVGSKLCFIGHG